MFEAIEIALELGDEAKLGVVERGVEIVEQRSSVFDNLGVGLIRLDGVALDQSEAVDGLLELTRFDGRVGA